MAFLVGKDFAGEIARDVVAYAFAMRDQLTVDFRAFELGFGTTFASGTGAAP